MELKNAYAVDINFDGDIASKATGFRIFAGENAKNEVRELVRQALKDMNNHRESWVFEGTVPVSEAVKDDKLLDEFIEYGGDMFGNWDIDIRHTGE